MVGVTIVLVKITIDLVYLSVLVFDLFSMILCEMYWKLEFVIISSDKLNVVFHVM